MSVLERNVRGTQSPHEKVFGTLLQNDFYCMTPHLRSLRIQGIAVEGERCEKRIGWSGPQSRAAERFRSTPSGRSEFCNRMCRPQAGELRGSQALHQSGFAKLYASLPATGGREDHVRWGHRHRDVYRGTALGSDPAAYRVSNMFHVEHLSYRFVRTIWIYLLH